MSFQAVSTGSGNTLDEGETPSARLYSLAHDVRRIGSGWRSDPESIAIQKDQVAHDLVALARELERR